MFWGLIYPPSLRPTLIFEFSTQILTFSSPLDPPGSVSQFVLGPNEAWDIRLPYSSCQNEDVFIVALMNWSRGEDFWDRLYFNWIQLFPMAERQMSHNSISDQRKTRTWSPWFFGGKTIVWPRNRLRLFMRPHFTPEPRVGTQIHRLNMELSPTRQKGYYGIPDTCLHFIDISRNFSFMVPRSINSSHNQSNYCPVC